MARYIDADKAMEEINRIGGHNLCEWETLGVKALIDRQPTADVVPKSEYDVVVSAVDNSTKEFLKLHDDYQEAKREVDRLKFNLKAVIDEIPETKSEVAREIFEEIESLHLHITNEFDLRRYNELKKKYTEEKYEN